MHTDKYMLERCSSPSLGRSLTRIFHSEVAKITQPQLAQASKPAVSQHLSRSVNDKSMASFFQNGGANTRPERPPHDSPGQRPGFDAIIAIKRCKRATIPASQRRIADFQTCGPWPFQPAFKRLCAWTFMGCSRLFPNHYEISRLNLMPFGNSELESQRDSIVQPRVATEELPWVNAPTMTYPNGVASPHRFPANLNFRKALRLNQVHNPDSESGDEIEQTFREPITVGRVTPCAPRLQPAGAEFPRHRLGRAFREYSIPTSELSFNRQSPT
jgi:hypothetical protein